MCGPTTCTGMWLTTCIYLPAFGHTSSPLLHTTIIVIQPTLLWPHDSLWYHHLHPITISVPLYFSPSQLTSLSLSSRPGAANATDTSQHHRLSLSPTVPETTATSRIPPDRWSQHEQYGHAWDACPTLQYFTCQHCLGSKEWQAHSIRTLDIWILHHQYNNLYFMVWLSIWSHKDCWNEDASTLDLVISPGELMHMSKYLTTQNLPALGV